MSLSLSSLPNASAALPFAVVAEPYQEISGEQGPRQNKGFQAMWTGPMRSPICMLIANHVFSKNNTSINCVQTYFKRFGGKYCYWNRPPKPEYAKMLIFVVTRTVNFPYLASCSSSLLFSNGSQGIVMANRRAFQKLLCSWAVPGIYRSTNHN